MLSSIPGQLDEVRGRHKFTISTALPRFTPMPHTEPRVFAGAPLMGLSSPVNKGSLMMAA